MDSIQSMRKIIPPAVEEIVECYLSLAQSNSQIRLDGFYVVGSVALEDYIKGSSDIDFVATVAEPLDEEKLSALREVHKKVRDFKSSNLQERIPNLDGFYIESRNLLAPPQNSRNAPFSFDGSLHVGETCFEANPVVWEVLRKKAIVFHGPSLSAKNVYQNRAELLNFSYDNLKNYWAPWVESTRKLLELKQGQAISAETMTWGVLGISRVGYLLESEEVSSKILAGKWAQNYFAEWKSIVAKACEWRKEPSQKKVPFSEAFEALAYIEFCLLRLLDKHRNLQEINQETK